MRPQQLLQNLGGGYTPPAAVAGLEGGIPPRDGSCNQFQDGGVYPPAEPAGLEGSIPPPRRLGDIPHLASG